MAAPQPFHTPPYQFPGALPAQQLQYWFNYLGNFTGNIIHTAFGANNQLLTLNPPMVNRPPEVPAPFNGPYPIKSTNPKTGRIKKEIGPGVLVGFLLLQGRNTPPGQLAWDPNEWSVVYGKMGKYPSKNPYRSSRAPRPRRRCTFSAKDRNYLSADADLGR
jgi:hypothetical protein